MRARSITADAKSTAAPRFAVLVGLSVLLCLLLMTPDDATSSISVSADGCPESQGGGAVLSAGLGPDQDPTMDVDYGEDSVLSGYLRDAGGRGVPDAIICIYGNVVTDETNTLIGLAVTKPEGRYDFQIPRGPSRTLTVVYRSSAGQLSAWALLQVRSTASLKFARNPVYNKHFGYFSGRIPGPDNDGVVVVLQVKIGEHWMTFHRYSTRDDGKFSLKYHFTRTFSPTLYTIRAEVPGAPGYPYLPGSSVPKVLRVLPGPAPDSGSN